MPSADLNENFSQRIIFPEAGAEGREKWAKSSILLAGGGSALRSAALALSNASVSQITLLIHKNFDPSFLASAPHQLNFEAIPLLDQLPVFSSAVVVSPEPLLRRRLNRLFRKNHQTAVFAWPCGSGYALFTSRYLNGCPCLECFEVLNPKAFSRGSVSVESLMGEAAASEVLKLILNGVSSLENKVWITALETGISVQHEVLPAYKCPARMIEGGAKVTP
jgi:hypothetical protein